MTADEFREMVIDAFDGFVIEPSELAHRLGVSKLTVYRWYHGENAPHEDMRKHAKAQIDLAREFDE